MDVQLPFLINTSIYGGGSKTGANGTLFKGFLRHRVIITPASVRSAPFLLLRVPGRSLIRLL